LFVDETEIKQQIFIVVLSGNPAKLCARRIDMKGYTQIASLLEKGIAAFLLLFGATMVMLMAGLFFVLLSQVGVLVKLSAAVALIFDSAGSLEAIFILLLKLIDLALIAVLITIIALSSYQSFVDDIDHLDRMDTEASRGIQKLGMMRPQQLKGKLISTVVGLSSIALLGTAFQIAEAYKNGLGMQSFPLEIGITAGIHVLFLATSLTMAFMERADAKR
jgi:uncharacterized protein (TIGR00645 family)